MLAGIRMGEGVEVLIPFLSGGPPIPGQLVNLAQYNISL